MSGEGKYDDVFMNILREEGQLIAFLDAVFGFMHRRTDFFIVKQSAEAKFGFPPGVAEKAVRNTFRKWQHLMLQDKNISSMQGDMTDLVINEEEVVTTEELPQESICFTDHRTENCGRDEDISGETYNGADCGSYRWSQTFSEVDIKVPVPLSVQKSSDVRVDIQPNQLSVVVKDPMGQKSTLVEGSIAHKHLRDESIWTLLPGKQITIHLQKVGEKWWDRLLTTDQPLDLSKLDVSKHVTELPEEDHMQVERVMAQEESKKKGLIMSEQQKQLDILNKAWNLEGSPFQGTPFDPSVLHFHP